MSCHECYECCVKAIIATVTMITNEIFDQLSVFLFALSFGIIVVFFFFLDFVLFCCSLDVNFFFFTFCDYVFLFLVMCVERVLFFYVNNKCFVFFWLIYKTKNRANSLRSGILILNKKTKRTFTETFCRCYLN